jgi:hypothetical protein
MSFFGSIARAYVVNRLVRGGRSSRGSRSGYGYRSGLGPRSGYGRRRQPPRSGFGMRGPFPSYSRQTRGGGRVHVTGCCLPIPLALATGAALGGRVALRAR